jgi:hypothetical protein
MELPRTIFIHKTMGGIARVGGRGWTAAGVLFSRGGPGLRPPKGNRRAVNNIGFGPQAGEGMENKEQGLNRRVHACAKTTVAS